MRATDELLSWISTTLFEKLYLSYVYFKTFRVNTSNKHANRQNSQSTKCITINKAHIL